MKRFFSFLLILVMAASCSNIDYPLYECGSIWGGERVVKGGEFHQKYFVAAKKGYIYSLAGALVLQTDDKESNEHYFSSLNRLRLVNELSQNDKDTGFEAATFELFESEDLRTLSEVVIAFAGSNDANDWIQNFSPFSNIQYRQAVNYVKKVKAISKYNNIPLKVTGYSLGGALAIHVTKNSNSSHLVEEAWAFNPSPKINVNGNVSEKIWLVAHRGEALSIFRSWIFRFLPGISNIGSTDEHTLDDFYLIKTNLFYGHYRWVLPMQMLHVADFEIMKERGGKGASTEPLEILQSTNFAGAKPCR